MKRYFFLLVTVSFLNPHSLFGTAQIPDILWYNGVKYSLYSNPLEAFYNEDNPRPESIVEQSCWSTACWRGYQATWKIINDQLYLVEIAGCCRWEEFQITDSVLFLLENKGVPKDVLDLLEPLKKVNPNNDYGMKEVLQETIGKSNAKKYGKQIMELSKLQNKPTADLQKLFGEHYQDGRVKAFWFSGDLNIPQGKLINYVHMGYMSTYEREVILEIEEGTVVSENEYENEPVSMPKNFKYVNATSFSFYAPADMIKTDENYWYPLTDTMEVYSPDSLNFFSTMSDFHRKRLDKEGKVNFVEGKIKDYISMNSDIEFKNPTVTKTRYGTCGWVDGTIGKLSIRYFIITNINGYMTLIYKEKDDPYMFLYNADIICESVNLMEFGY